METSIERLEGDRVKLSIVLSPEEVDRAVSGAYHRLAGEVRIPGFRSGKAPRAVIDTHVGRERVLATALEDLVEDSYPRALAAEKLRPIERPDVGTLDGLVPGEGYTFTAEFDARPELTLSSVEGLKVAVPPASSSDEEIDAQISYLRDRFSSLEPVEGRGVADGDFALLSFVGTIDGEEYEGNTVDKYLYELGSGQMPPEFDAAMLGAKPGDSVKASFPVPETSSVADYIGKTAEFDITVHEIKAKVLPELDDEFASNAAGFETLEEMRDDIRGKLDENKHVARVRQMERGARAALAERLEGDVPERMVESRSSQMYEEFFESLAERKITMEQYVEATGVDSDQIRADIEKEAEFRVRDDLALEALFRAQGLEITDEEMSAEIGRLADAEKKDQAEIMERLVSTGLLALVREDLVHRKAVRWLMDNVEFVDEEPPGGKTPKKKAAGTTEASGKTRSKPKASSRAKTDDKSGAKAAGSRKPVEPAEGSEE